jgi:hypothetical protein
VQHLLQESGHFIAALFSHFLQRFLVTFCSTFSETCAALFSAFAFLLESAALIYVPSVTFL